MSDNSSTNIYSINNYEDTRVENSLSLGHLAHTINNFDIRPIPQY